MKKKYLIILFIVIFSIRAFTQNERKAYLNRITLGTSLTYIPDEYEKPTYFKYYEYTWNVNLSIDINSHWRTGLQYMSIFTKKNSQKNGNYFIVGPFLQYNIFPSITKKNRLYIESSLNLGNYCTCDPNEPHLKDNLIYNSLGIGFDWAVSKYFHLDLALLNYNILNKFPEKYNYTQYIIGIDIPFSIKK